MTRPELSYNFCYFHNKYDTLQQFFNYYGYVKLEGTAFTLKNPNKRS